MTQASNKRKSDPHSSGLFCLLQCKDVFGVTIYYYILIVLCSIFCFTIQRCPFHISVPQQYKCTCMNMLEEAIGSDSGSYCCGLIGSSVISMHCSQKTCALHLCQCLIEIVLIFFQGYFIF